MSFISSQIRSIIVGLNRRSAIRWLWGSPVASGVYFARFKSGEFIESKKMILLK